eukprot:TRINITY_DN649_c0_g1_i2.p1 TRINITY_DN649_c0_g1~~TRINITY_DN649_c0_g1_i2.p1  ORF type:complete len:343 (-),score=68.83 TRINITY_DN649_c0_g1_i2:878-1906(-)
MLRKLSRSAWQQAARLGFASSGSSSGSGTGTNSSQSGSGFNRGYYIMATAPLLLYSGEISEALPAPKPGPHVSVLKVNGSEVHVIGTSHVSKESAQEVKSLIEEVQPSAVMLEIAEDTEGAILDKEKYNETLTWGARRPETVFEGLVLRHVQDVATQSKVFPGEDLRAANTAAGEVGAEVVMGDRPQKVTYTRQAREMWSFLGSLHYIYQKYFGQDLGQELKKAGVTYDQAIESTDPDFQRKWVEKQYNTWPTLVDITLNQRDQFMAATLQEMSKDHSKVVAVVDAKHLRGIEQWPDFGCEGIKVQRAHQPTSQCLGRRHTIQGISRRGFKSCQHCCWGSWS